jgi:hypothetical protein
MKRPASVTRARRCSGLELRRSPNVHDARTSASTVSGICRQPVGRRGGVRPRVEVSAGGPNGYFDPERVCDVRRPCRPPFAADIGLGSRTPPPAASGCSTGGLKEGRCATRRRMAPPAEFAALVRHAATTAERWEERSARQGAVETREATTAALRKTASQLRTAAQDAQADTRRTCVTARATGSHR